MDAAQDLFRPGHHVVGGGVQPGPHVRDDPVEGDGVPGGAAGLGDEAVDGAGDGVGEQGGDRAVRVVGQDELLRGGEPLRDLVRRGLHGEQHEAPCPGAHRTGGRPGRFEQADVNGRARIDKRGVRLDLPVGEDPRELPEVPGGHAGPGQRGGAGGERRPDLGR